MNQRLVSPEAAPADAEPSLRPQRLDEFIGQTQLCHKCGCSSTPHASGARRSIMFCSPGRPGLARPRSPRSSPPSSGSAWSDRAGDVRAGDLAAQLTNLQPRDVLFIDEIHRLAPAVEEILYPALEEFQLDLMIGEGPAGAALGRIDLPPFTLIGATTRTGLLTTPCAIASASSRACTSTTTPSSRRFVARRGDSGRGADPRGRGRDRIGAARGTPRVASRLLRRVRDFATVGGAEVDAAVADRARSPSSRSTISAWTAWTGAISGPSP